MLQEKIESDLLKRRTKIRFLLFFSQGRKLSKEIRHYFFRERDYRRVSELCFLKSENGGVESLFHTTTPLSIKSSNIQNCAL